MIYVENDRLKTIAVFVATVHVVLLTAFLLIAPNAPTFVKPKKLVVQTVQLTPKSQPVPVKKELPKAIEKTTVKEIAIAEPKPAVKPRVKPVVKAAPKPTLKQAAKPLVKPAPKAESKPAVKPVAAPRTQASPEPTQKNAPSKATLDAIKAKLAAMPSVSSVETKMEMEESSYGYEEELTRRLKILLKLPEIGDVKVQLTVNRQGKIVKTEILSAANAMNRKAVESALPTIQFPPFAQAFSGENTHIFTITLTNL